MHEHTVSHQHGMTAIAIDCAQCGRTFHFFAPTENYRRWRDRGENIQNAMPDLTAGQRELLISGTCPECWNKLFGEEDDDE